MKKIILIVALIISSFSQAQIWTNYTSDDGLIEGFIYDMIQDTDGTIWFCEWTDDTKPGIGNFDGTTWMQFGIGDGPSANTYRTIIQDSNGVYWFGSFFADAGLDRYDGTTWENFDTSDGLPFEGNVRDLIEAEDGTLWLTAGGLTSFDGTTFTNLDVSDGLPGLNTSKLFEDSQGNIWIGTIGTGVAMYDGSNFTNYSTVDGLIADDIFGIFEDQDNNMWFTTHSSGASKFDGVNWTSFTQADGLASSQTWALGMDNAGLVYVGTDAGISRYDGNSFETFDITDGLVENHIRSILKDEDGLMWFGTWGGVSRFNPILGVFDTLKEKITIHPNPANSVLNITLNAEIKSVEVYSITGAQVLSISENNITQIDVTGLQQGMYWVKIIDDLDRIGFEKVMIN